MNESKTSRDRLSDLPDLLIFEIFSLSQMRDVVRTTILSKRWNNLWKTTPYFSFDSMYHSLEFVNRALTLWKGLGVPKFKIVLLHWNHDEGWVRLVTDHGVEELYMVGQDFDYELFSVQQNLKVLSLKNCIFQVPPTTNVQWNQLKSLTIDCRCHVDEDLINQIVCGSPQLEAFSLLLLLLSGPYNLRIRSTSLKRLLIRKESYASAATELRIWSPNLETLDILEETYDKFPIMNVPCLTHLTLDLYGFHSNESIDGSLVHIFPTIQHVESLTLSCYCIKVLGALINEKLVPSPLLNLKSLSVTLTDYTCEEHKQILVFLQFLPQLKTLLFQHILIYYPYINPVKNATSLLQVEINLPESFLLQLRTVEIPWIGRDSDLIFEFLEILLKHASNLQKMVFRVKGGIKTSLRGALEQKVLKIPRSSQTAEFTFC